jgi:hypothetical protein
LSVHVKAYPGWARSVCSGSVQGMKAVQAVLIDG